MKWIKRAKWVHNLNAQREYYFYPMSLEPSKEIKEFLYVMGNTNPGCITIYNREELVLAILLYREFIKYEKVIPISVS